MPKLIVYHIPLCPFCQRLQILLDLKGLRETVEFRVVDVTKPRPAELLKKTRGTTALPVLELEDGRILKESLVILRYLDEIFPERPVAQSDPYRRAVEGMMISMEKDYSTPGYALVKNTDPARRGALREAMLSIYSKLDGFLLEHNPEGTFLFDDFGFAEVAFTPLFMRFWLHDYYEGFKLSEAEGLARVRRYYEACVAHPAARQTSMEQIVKVYYDYAKGAMGGALLPGRSVSSFSLEPTHDKRPWPPADKYGYSATDAELGLTV